MYLCVSVYMYVLGLCVCGLTWVYDSTKHFDHSFIQQAFIDGLIYASN